MAFPPQYISDTYKRAGEIKTLPNPRYHRLHNALTSVDFVSDKPLHLRAADSTLPSQNQPQLSDDNLAVATVPCGSIKYPLAPVDYVEGISGSEFALEAVDDLTQGDASGTSKYLKTLTYRGQARGDFRNWTKYTVLSEAYDFTVLNRRPFPILFGIYAEVGDIVVNNQSFDGEDFGYPVWGDLCRNGALNAGLVSKEYLQSLPNCKTWVIPSAERMNNPIMTNVAQDGDSVVAGAGAVTHSTHDNETGSHYQQVQHSVNPPRYGKKHIQFHLDVVDMVERLAIEHTGQPVNLQKLQGTFSPTATSITVPKYCGGTSGVASEGIRLVFFARPLYAEYVDTRGTTGTNDDQQAQLMFSNHLVSKRAACIDLQLHHLQVRKQILLTDPKDLTDGGLTRHEDVASM